MIALSQTTLEMSDQELAGLRGFKAEVSNLLGQKCQVFGYDAAKLLEGAKQNMAELPAQACRVPVCH